MGPRVWSLFKSPGKIRLRHPNSSQDTERAVDQTHKSKSHSKDKDESRFTSPHVEKTRPENSSAQSAGKASKRKSASQSRKL